MVGHDQCRHVRAVSLRSACSKRHPPVWIRIVPRRLISHGLFYFHPVDSVRPVIFSEIFYGFGIAATSICLNLVDLGGLYCTTQWALRSGEFNWSSRFIEGLLHERCPQTN